MKQPSLLDIAGKILVRPWLWPAVAVAPMIPPAALCVAAPILAAEALASALDPRGRR